MLMSAVVYLSLQVTVILDTVSTAEYAIWAYRMIAFVKTAFMDRFVSTVRIACRFLCLCFFVYTAIFSKLFA